MTVAEHVSGAELADFPLSAAQALAAYFSDFRSPCTPFPIRDPLPLCAPPDFLTLTHGSASPLRSRKAPINCMSSV